jgi:hypothetical protein
MGHWALVLSDSCRASRLTSTEAQYKSLDGAGAEVSRKACGIATLRAQPLVEKYWAWGISDFLHSLFRNCSCNWITLAIADLFTVSVVTIRYVRFDQTWN